MIGWLFILCFFFSSGPQCFAASIFFAFSVSNPCVGSSVPPSLSWILSQSAALFLSQFLFLALSVRLSRSVTARLSVCLSSFSDYTW